MRGPMTRAMTVKIPMVRVATVKAYKTYIPAGKDGRLRVRYKAIANYFSEWLSLTALHTMATVAACVSHCLFVGFELG